MLMGALHKLRSLWRSGGPRAVMRALVARLLFKRWSSLVFVDESAGPPVPVDWPQGYRYHWYSRALELSASERTALGRQGASDFLDALAAIDGLYVVWHGADVASYGAVMMRSPQRSVLGLPDAACLIGLCETVSGHRMRGLYSRALRQTVRVLRDHGHEAIFIEVKEENTASIAGIVKAGFRHWGRVDAQIWLGCLVRRSGRWHRLRRGE